MVCPQVVLTRQRVAQGSKVLVVLVELTRARPLAVLQVLKEHVLAEVLVVVVNCSHGCVIVRVSKVLLLPR